MQIYHPSETISGAVEFTLTKPKHYDCIEVNFLGSARARWSAGNINFVGQETYVENSIPLWNSQQSCSGTIGPGSFSFPFQFVIPPHVPSSFNFRDGAYLHGYISYRIKAYAVTGAFQFHHKVSTEIFISRLTSCSETSLMAPVREVRRKEVGCLCCAAGDVEFIAKLPRTGYCVTPDGDKIPLTVDVQNNSTRLIKMKAKIIQRVTMSVRENVFVSIKSMTKISSEIIQPGVSYVWSPANWIVPPTLSTTLLGCRILRVDYYLEVSAVIPRALNLRCNIPIFIGNLSSPSSDNPVDEHITALVNAVVSALVQNRDVATSRHDGVDKNQQQCE